MYCPKCRDLLPDNAKFCPKCGTQMPTPGPAQYTAKAPTYVVLQVTLRERFIGTGSGNLLELEEVINQQAAKGYRLHTISTASGHSTGAFGGDRIQATMVFEKL